MFFPFFWRGGLLKNKLVNYGALRRRLLRRINPISLAGVGGVLFQCGGIWCAARFPKVKACDGSLVPVNHYCRSEGPSVHCAFKRERDREGEREREREREIWRCIVMSLEKCMIPGNKGVVARVWWWRRRRWCCWWWMAAGCLVEGRCVF